MIYIGARRQEPAAPRRLAVLIALCAAIVVSTFVFRLPGGDTDSAGGEPASGASAPVGAATDPCAGLRDGAAASAAPSAAAAAAPAALPSGSAPACHDHGAPVSSAFFIAINKVKSNVQSPPAGPDASTGTFVSDCGRNLNGHRNSDNFLTLAGVTNGAHHTHDYVGNLSTDAFTTDETLAAAGTTCQLDDLSTYFWPVLRRTDAAGSDVDAAGGGLDGNIGEILVPVSVRVEYRGNPQAKVVAMPKFLKMITGDAAAATNGGAKARAQWTCTGFTDRITTKYPLCPEGKGLRRVFAFPGCWDGKNADSANHRTHAVFPQKDGACPAGTKAIPQLQVTLVYDVPPGPKYALDSFPEQKRNPLTDHGVFANVMPDGLMAFAVNCINTGQSC